MAAAALPATAVWEMRSTGAATNGGIWDSANPGGAGTDYSMSDTPIISRTNFTCTTGGTTLVTATASTFTAAMVNNWIYLSGTNFNTGRYKIVAYIDQYSVTLCADPTDGTNGTNGTGNVGGGIYEVNGTNIVALNTLVVAGNIIFWKGLANSAALWTITTASWTAGTVGTVTGGITNIGYLGTRTATTYTAATGDDRPLLDFNSRTIVSAVYWNWKNIRVTGTSNNCFNFSASAGAIIINCSFKNTATNAAYGMVVNSIANRFISCEFSFPYAICCTGGNIPYFFNCWFHDSLTACSTAAGGGARFQYCIFSACSTAITNTTGGTYLIEGCTFVNNGTAILSSGASFNHLIINNIFAYNTTGVNWSGTINYTSNVYRYNNWYGNVTDVLYATKGTTDTTNDPIFQGFKEWTDLACADHSAAGGGYTLTSAAGGFSARFVAGDLLWIETNTGHWVSNVYLISTVTNDTTLLLALDPTDGTDATSGHGQDTYDARIGVYSLCKGAGQGVSLGVGIASKPDQGCWQDQFAGYNLTSII